MEEVKRTYRELVAIAENHGINPSTVRARYQRNKKASIEELTRKVESPFKIVETGIPGFTDITSLSKAFNLDAVTLLNRHSRGDRGLKLIRRPEQRGRPRVVRGRTFAKWSTYFAIRGWSHNPDYFCRAYCRFKKDKKWSDAQIVSYWKDKFKDKYQKEEEGEA